MSASGNKLSEGTTTSTALPLEIEQRTLDSGEGEDRAEESDGNKNGESKPPSQSDSDEIEEDPETQTSQKNLPTSSSSSSSESDGMRAKKEENEDYEDYEDYDQEAALAELPQAIAMADAQPHGCEFSSVVIQSLNDLPQLPEPRHDILKGEVKTGVSFVLAVVVLSIFLVHYIALTLLLPSSSLDNFETATDNGLLDETTTKRAITNVGKTVFLVLLYAEAVVALVCMVGIYTADPCVIQRTMETCNPVPLEVESWVVRAPTSPRPPKLAPYLQGPDRTIYCTKCLVWRRTRGVTHFHCAICERCCAYHDHHCNVFGRCIAGNPRFWESGSSCGNRLYFYGILATGAWTLVTVFGAFLYAASARFGAKLAIPIGILVIALAMCCCFGSGPIQILCWPCSRALRILKNSGRCRLMRQRQQR